MKKFALLRSNEGSFVLSPKITTIGRDLCDFIIQNITVDSQQAIIEYLEDKECYVLKDLNSTYGTYVNEFRIQNNSIRLTNGTIIKFGLHREKYEFYFQEGNGNTVPISNRKSWQQNAIQPVQYSNLQPSTNLPVISIQAPIQQKHLVPGFGSWDKLPSSANPKIIRRPISEKSTDKRDYDVESRIQYPRDQKSQSNEGQSLVDLQNETERMRGMETQYKLQCKRIDELIQANATDKVLIEQGNEHIKQLMDQVTQKSNEVERLDKVVERLSCATNKNVANLDSVISLERLETEKIRKDLQTSNRLVTTLQKDLSTHDVKMKSMKNDIENLNRIISEKDVSISSLVHNLSRLKNVQERIQEDELEALNKDQELISLKNKLKTADKNILDKEEQLESLTAIVAELRHKEKVINDNLRNINLKLAESNVLNVDLQRSETSSRLAAQDYQNKYTKLRTQVLLATLSPHEYEHQNNFIVDGDLENIVQQLSESNRQKDKLLEEAIKKQQHTLDNIEVFIQFLKEYSNTFTSEQRTSIAIRDCVDSLQSVTCEDCLQSLKDGIIVSVICVREFLSKLESCIQNSCPEFTHYDILECMEKVIERYKEALENQSHLEIELRRLTEGHDFEIKKLKEEHENKIAFKVSESVKTETSRIEAELNRLREETLRLDKEQRDTLSRDYEQIIDNLKKIASDSELQLQDERKLLNDKTSDYEDLKEQLRTAIESKNALDLSLRCQIDAMKSNLQSEINGYDEEIANYRTTCFDLNSQLTILTKENKDLNNQITKIRSEKKKKDFKKLNGTDEAYQTAVMSSKDYNATIANLEQCLAIVRNENLVLKSKNIEFEDKIKNLSYADIQNGSLNTELNNSILKDIESLTSEKATLEKETEEARTQMSHLTSTVDELTRRIKDKTTELENIAPQITSVENSKRQNLDGYFEGEYRMSSELVTLGSQCRGERHLQIINAQKTALAELRQRMKAIDTTRFNEASVQEYTQQISLLKREVAELRAKQELKERVPNGGNSIADMILNRSTVRQSQSDKELEKENNELLKAISDNNHLTRALKQMELDLAIEKSARTDIQNSFKISESSYHDLIRQLFDQLDIQMNKSLDSIDNLSFDAKRILQKEREEYARQIMQKIIIYKEKIERKDELLQGYEKDLAKLKQSEDITMRTHIQMEEILQQTRGKSDEIELLRETLTRTKDLLNQEKRVNYAIKHDKCQNPDMIVVQSRSGSASPRHHCLPEDSTKQEKEKRKVEKMKRKHYEIETLKFELNKKERQLLLATNRLNNLETTMGIKCEEESET